MTQTPPPWLEGALDAQRHAVVLVGMDRTISYASPEAERVFGCTPGALLGVNMERLAVAERRGELRNVDDVLNGGGARRLRTVLRRDDGSRVTATACFEPCSDAHGELQAVLVRYELLAPARSLLPSSVPPRSRPPARESSGPVAANASAASSSPPQAQGSDAPPPSSALAPAPSTPAQAAGTPAKAPSTPAKPATPAQTPSTPARAAAGEGYEAARPPSETPTVPTAAVRRSSGAPGPGGRPSPQLASRAATPPPLRGEMGLDPLPFSARRAAGSTPAPRGLLRDPSLTGIRAPSLPPATDGDSSPPGYDRQRSISHRSEQRLVPARSPAAHALESQLRELDEQLRWLEQRLSTPASVAPLDDDRERARGLIVLSKARELLRSSLDLMVTDEPDALPAPPRVPKL